MIDVKFYDDVEDGLLKFAVIVSRHNGRWVYCKHRERDTFEVPGGHREPGEDIDAAAMRELFEETGAVKYKLQPVCVYSVVRSGEHNNETFGKLYYAEITAFDALPDFEIEKVYLFDSMPDNLTYPDIQPKLVRKINETVLAKQ